MGTYAHKYIDSSFKQTACAMYYLKKKKANMA